MSDTNPTPDAESSSNDETPMVPRELTPEQRSDDPVVGDPDATDLPYLRAPNGADDWERVRREEAMTPEAVSAVSVRS